MANAAVRCRSEAETRPINKGFCLERGGGEKFSGLPDALA
jgi:hypothetical protein